VNYTSTYTNYARNAVSNACLDTDGDGIRDVVDIDDDNDGVLDRDEMTGCVPDNVYDITCSDLSDYRWVNFSSVMPNTTAVGTVTLATGEVISVTYTGDACSLQPSDMSNSSLFCPTIPNGNQMIQTYSGAGLTHKFVFSKPVLNPAFHVWSLGNSNAVITYTFSAPVRVLRGNNLLNQTAVNAVTGNEGFGTIIFAGLVSEISFTASGSENWSGLQVLFGRTVNDPNDNVCDGTLDTDGDGIPNQLDTDSDGDGCSDAYEAGATTNTTSNYTFPGPYGNNGLANSLETGTESGMVNYNSTYNSVALSGGVSSCLDTDGDGTSDMVDIDDDNDGITDMDEGCQIQSQDMRTLAWTTADISMNVSAPSSNQLTSEGLASSWRNEFSTQTFTLPLDMSYTYTQTTGNAMLGVAPVGGTVVSNNWNSTGFGFYIQGTTTQLRYNQVLGTTYNNTVNQVHRITITPNGTLTLYINGAQV
jgi:hypothetical protein